MRIAILALVLAGCGSRTELLADPPPARDAVAPDAGSCVPEWRACRVAVGPITVSAAELGQGPDSCWLGDRLLVVYDGSAGNTVVALDLGGRELFRAEVGGIQAPRIACHPEAGTALVAADSGLRWLGPDGRPVGSFLRVDLGFQMQADPSAVEGGFVVLTGASAFATPPELLAARVPPTPRDAVDFETIGMGGPRYVGEHAEDDRGLGTVAISAAQGFRPIDVWDLGAPGLPTFLRAPEISATDPYVLGIDDRGGRTIVLYSQSLGVAGWGFYLTDLDTMHTRLAAESRQDLGGHLERLGDDLIAAVRTADEPGGPERVVVGRASLEGTDAIAEVIPLAPPGPTSHSARIARTPRGLAITFAELTGETDGLSARLAILDCCP